MLRLLLGFLTLTTLLVGLAAPAAAGEKIAVAAAADLKFAMDELVVAFRQRRPQDDIDVSYGSSGKFHTQIRQGAPFDLFFSADIAYPQALAAAGLSAGPPRRYAIGRLVIWTPGRNARGLTLDRLADPSFRRIAIANPRHAPYGVRAEEALRARGLWERVESRLVYGENIAQTAQFAQTGNADAAIIALSLASAPALAGKEDFVLIPEALHSPLDQGVVITRRGAGKVAAQAFVDFVTSGKGRAILERYGFQLPPAAGG